MRTRFRGLHSRMLVGVGAVVGCAAVAAGTAYGLGLPGGGDPEQQSAAFADAGRFLPGRANDSAVAEATGFTEFPILWLGKEFGGFHLTAIQRVDVVDDNAYGFPEGYRDNRVVLIYGECDPDVSGEGPSCMPPLQVQIQTGNIIPPIDEVSGDANPSDIFVKRGVKGRNIGSSIFLWLENGLVVSVSGEVDTRERAVAALQLANGDALGAGKPADDADLSSIGAIPIPAGANPR